MPSWSRVARTLACAAGLPLALTQYSSEYLCDSAEVAFVLPGPGDSVALTGLACADGGTVNVQVKYAGTDAASSGLAVVALAPDGQDILVPGFLDGSRTIAQAHCDPGLAITIEHVGPAGSAAIAGVVRISVEGTEPLRCDVALEVP